MQYSMQDAIKYLDQCGFKVKMGTVMNFREKLVSAGILGNNQSMSQEHMDVLHKIVKEKTENTTWEKLMNQHIYKEFRKDIDVPFEWTDNILRSHLLWSLKEERFQIEEMDVHIGSEDFHAFCCCIDNFAELGKEHHLYQGSCGTDGNPATSFKIITPGNEFYYIIGKLNQYTFEEDYYVFYNAASYFDIMKCRYVFSGDCEDEWFKEISEQYKKRKNNTIGKKATVMVQRTTRK